MKDFFAEWWTDHESLFVDCLLDAQRKGEFSSMLKNIALVSWEEGRRNAS